MQFDLLGAGLRGLLLALYFLQLLILSQAHAQAQGATKAKGEGGYLCAPAIVGARLSRGEPRARCCPTIAGARGFRHLARQTIGVVVGGLLMQFEGNLQKQVVGLVGNY